MRAHYDVDKPLVSDPKFMAWVAELETMMDRWNRPYGDGPLSETTGLMCWHGYYLDGYTPKDALIEDMSYD